MTYATYAKSHIRLANDRISLEDADRQERAAAEILSRLHRQPGVVLADEVGMGKTFVAMAVAVSILLERGEDGPVVVMYPPNLREKWPKDWDIFKSKCLPEPVSGRLRAASANSGIEFLKLLDDPADRRAHVIFLAHGALHRAIGDGFAKLAVIKRVQRTIVLEHPTAEFLAIRRQAALARLGRAAISWSAWQAYGSALRWLVKASSARR